MNLYAESSAVLAWLLDEPTSPEVRRLLTAADLIVTSDLTSIECDRVLLRAIALKEITPAEAADRQAHMAAAVARWQVLRISPEIVERARQPFPGDPLRTLDAIHLASLLIGRSAISGLELLSLDERVRQTARRLGVNVLPS